MITSTIVYLTLIVCFVALFAVVQLLENAIAKTPPATRYRQKMSRDAERPSAPLQRS
jgi:hypothetical protein